MTVTALSVLLFLLTVGQTPPAPAVEARSPIPIPAPRAPVEFPERAMAEGVTSGAATVNCGFLPDGLLTDCRIVSEDPPGMGFGQAVVRGSRRMRISPTTMAVAPDARVEFTTRFMLAESTPVAERAGNARP